MDVARLESAAGGPEGERACRLWSRPSLPWEMGSRPNSRSTGPRWNRAIRGIFQVTHQGGAGLVGAGAESAESLRVFVVGVPGLTAEE